METNKENHRGQRQPQQQRTPPQRDRQRPRPCQWQRAQARYRPRFEYGAGYRRRSRPALGRAFARRDRRAGATPRSPSQKSQPLICAAPVGPESDICGDVVIETRRKCSIYRRHSDSVEPEIRGNWTYETGSSTPPSSASAGDAPGAPSRTSRATTPSPRPTGCSASADGATSWSQT